MLGKLMQRGVARNAIKMGKMVQPGQYVCFCGCAGGKVCSNSITSTQQRGFQGHLGLDSSKNLLPQEFNQDNQVSMWKDIKAKQENRLVLSTDDQIADYVLSLTKNYFRTTKKASVTLDATFTDHGLDSLDVIELVIQVEDELGYLIDAEKLELFHKPRHFVNYISQMEAYKTEHNRFPHDKVIKTTKEKIYEAFPGLPEMGH